MGVPGPNHWATLKGISKMFFLIVLDTEINQKTHQRTYYITLLLERDKSLEHRRVISIGGVLKRQQQCGSTCHC